MSLFVHTGFFANRSCQDVDFLVHSIDLYVELQVLTFTSMPVGGLGRVKVEVVYMHCIQIHTHSNSKNVIDAHVM